MSNIKSRRVFQLRKTSTVKPLVEKQSLNEGSQANESGVHNIMNNNSHVSAKKEEINNNSSIFRDTKERSLQDPYKQQKPQKWIPLVDGPELKVNVQELFFKEKINIIQVKDLKIKNIGSSSIYYELCFKNLSKISSAAIKDPKPKFHCHYEPSVILPGQQLTFSFSFISEIPGIFIEECQIIYRPETQTKILPIKLKGEAYIIDGFKSKREQFKQKFQQKIQQKFVREVVDDIINAVKSPEPPLPDVTDSSVAQKLFEERNWSKGLYYDPKVHQWFDSLFRQSWQKVNGQDASNAYWDQSIDTLKGLIQKVDDQCLQESYKRRLQNYCYLSSTPSKSSNKSDLFQTVKQFILEAGYKVGGDVTDEVKKQMEMWEIPFQEPRQQKTEQQAKAQEEQKAKIKAEWAKKMKKKKWGEEQERQVVKQYRAKALQKIKQCVANKFQGFSSQADLIKNEKKFSQKIDYKNHFEFLERLKTVKQYKVEGKRIFLKFNLKLKDSSEQKLKQLEEYLIKKKQQELKQQEEKKNQQMNAKKKKASTVKKKKGQKQEEQVKPAFFDFDSFLDQEAWNGVVETIKTIIERQPFLLVIGCSYGPRKGIFQSKYSVKFLLEHIKKSESSIEFLSHQQLFQIPEKLQQEQLNQGSIYLTENLNFLPCQVMQQQKTTEIEPATQQKQAVTSSQIEKLLMSEIRQSLNKIESCFELIVTQDRTANISGITTYSSCQKILGTYSWKYVAISLQIKAGNLVIGGDFTPKRFLLLRRLLDITAKIYLTGKLGAKFYLAQQQGLKLFNIQTNDAEKQGILRFLKMLEQNGQRDKLVIPQDFQITYYEEKNIEGQQQPQKVFKKCQYLKQQQYPENATLSDIGQKTVSSLLAGTTKQEGQCRYFIINRPQIVLPTDQKSPSSLTTICRDLYKKQEIKKQRHQKQSSSNQGIDYENDLVVYFVGITEDQVQKIEIIPKKQQKVNEQGQEQFQEEPEEDDPENQKKKIDLVADYKLYSPEVFESILACQFDPGFKDVSRYPKSD